MICLDEDAILEIINIGKTFSSVEVLKNINLKIHRNEIHAIVGENGAGKSTLMKIIYGEYSPTEGTLIINGEKRNHYSPSEALHEGIVMVHQESSLVPTLSVYENIFLGRWNSSKTNKNYLVTKKELISLTREILRKMGVYHISPEARVSTLGIGDKQIVEIAKSLSFNPKILILDEPTAALSIEETNILFSILKTLKENGVTILYISHRLEEIFQIAERVTVLRNGEIVYNDFVHKINVNELISKMIGREITNKYPEKINKTYGKIVLKVEDLTSPYFNKITFEIHEGEILGMSGLMGCGSTQVGESLFGLRKINSGNIYYYGERFFSKNPSICIKHGIFYVPADRHSLGLVLKRSVKENYTLPNLDFFAKHGILKINKEKQDCYRTINQLNIKISNLNQKVENLSGGNQQKLVIGKWIVRQPKLLIMDEPTRGVDVGAKYEIYKKIYELSSKGIAILLISTDIDEIHNLCDRILVMSEGRITGTLYPENSSKEEILALAVKGKEDINTQEFEVINN